MRVVLEAEGCVCDGSCAVVTAILNGSLELLAGDVAGAVKTGGVDVGNRKLGASDGADAETELRGSRRSSRVMPFWKV